MKYYFMVAALLLISGCQTTEPPAEITQDNLLSVHYIDVGQGDATLFDAPDGTILIDTGRHDREEVVPYLQKAGIEEIDLVIGTHPHADHIGQMEEVLASFPVDEVWMSGGEHTTATFERTLDAIIESEANYHEPRRGEEYVIGDLSVDVLHPDELTGDLNEDSVSVRISYDSISFIVTGDAEEEGEAAMVRESREQLHADILKLGHHGSSTSTNPDFLSAVAPEVALYSAGRANEYGHPHNEVIERVEGAGIPVLGTPEHGTILVITDGEEYWLEAEHENEELQEALEAS
ncbi:ComEC/Rec2 family competence protein [Bacillus sp. FJAT-44742]|uniref:ComEC/Rec2 family competence protein n=1 Tax=Bacillus sp. FJAT-44742 TaxID=2014005 RepID=UPI000C2404F7|nr:ComEC/Rec2 family competence protein [Bacillus sp. FJAT-44742]